MVERRTRTTLVPAKSLEEEEASIEMDACLESLKLARSLRARVRSLRSAGALKSLEMIFEDIRTEPTRGAHYLPVKICTSVLHAPMSTRNIHIT